MFSLFFFLGVFVNTYAPITRAVRPFIEVNGNTDLLFFSPRELRQSVTRLSGMSSYPNVRLTYFESCRSLTWVYHSFVGVKFTLEARRIPAIHCERECGR